MMDPRDFRSDPRASQSNDDLPGGYRENDRAASVGRNGSSIWAWLVGVAAAIFIAAIIYGFANGNPQTALDRNAPKATPGSSPSGASTTGSGGADGARRMGVSGGGSTLPGAVPNAQRQSGQ